MISKQKKDIKLPFDDSEDEDGERQKLLKRIIEWNKKILQPAVQRLLRSHKKLNWFKTQKRSQVGQNNILDGLNDETLESEERNYGAMRGISIVQKPFYREFRPMRGLPVS